MWRFMVNPACSSSAPTASVRCSVAQVAVSRAPRCRDAAQSAAHNQRHAYCQNGFRARCFHPSRSSALSAVQRPMLALVLCAKKLFWPHLPPEIWILIREKAADDAVAVTASKVREAIGR
eukprot:m.53874 g.53874  ORF g.53874 m.53874 type:complete len:120 (+) comp6805_c0_seq3:187-546(+)